MPRLKQRGEPLRSCHLQLSNWPDNGGYHAERKHALYTFVDPISPPSQIAWLIGIDKPHVKQQEATHGGGAGYRPRVRTAYCNGHLSS